MSDRYENRGHVFFIVDSQVVKFVRVLAKNKGVLPPLNDCTLSMINLEVKISIQNDFLRTNMASAKRINTNTRSKQLASQMQKRHSEVQRAVEEK